MVLILLTLALLVGVSLGIGWLLTLVLPFSLFEGTIVGMIASIATWAIWYNVLRDVYKFELEEQERFDVAEIPVTRFCKTEADKTWANWFRYVLANSIYADLLASPFWGEAMDAGHLREKSIHLADAAVESLQKRSRAKRLRVSRAQLRQQFTKANQHPYDEDILDVAATALNRDLPYLKDQLRFVIQNDEWTEQAEVSW
jgi:hypothetical protein